MNKDFDEWFSSLSEEEQQQYIDELEADYYCNEEPSVIMDYEGYCSLA